MNQTKYILVTWPDCQDLMTKPWFHECVFVQDIRDHVECGSSAYMVPEERYEELYGESNKLPTIRLIHLEMLSLCMTIGNPFIKDRAVEFASIQSFNEWMEDISVQSDCNEYFPKVAKIGAKLLIVPSPCQIV